MDQETNDLIARQYLSEKNLSQVEPKELAAWAALELGRGHDSSNLRRLAETPDTENPSEVEAQFRECISDLGWEVPSKKSALKRYSKSIMQSIVDGTIEPYDGCSQLYVNSIYLEHPDYLYNWNFLFWSMEDLSREELDPLIIDEARQALGIKPEVPVGEIDTPDAEADQPQSFWDRFKALFGF